ncbi:MAG: magnesium-translocating P-type ATPase [Candidatus Brockarchaeota archaeon]|nr:magnesium-translocating P-type ATPase [Candidatus Brockarchaeota archaeon]
MAKEKTITRQRDYWSISPSDVYQALETSEQGLSEQEAQRRLKIYGYNELPREAFSWIQVLLRQFKNPIFVILIACAIVAGFFGQADQSIVILSMIALSVILGFFNEYRAEKSVVDLQRKVSIKAVVTRDGKPSEIDSKLLVPGDLVSVYVGDIIPADMRIVESKDLQVNEAVLTGESFPVEKTCESLALQQPIPQQLTNYLFMGTVVVYGSGRGVVVATGKNTEFGAISRSLARAHPETEFQRGIKSYGTMLLTFALVLTIGIFGLNALIGRNLIDALLFSLAVAIGLVPELMPAIVTISLAQGAQRMAKKQVIVKRLVSIEDLGSMNILCTDKTGTLTEGNIVLRDYSSLDGGKEQRILLYSLLCNSAVLGEKVVGNPMDVAIWKYATDNGVKESLKSYTKVDEIPFDYQRRIMSVVVRKDDELIFISKGAPESILSRCKYAEIKGRREQIQSVMESINAKFLDLSQLGYRVLAVAYRNVDSKASYSVEDERDLTFLGFLVFTDPPKKDAHQAVNKLKEMGVDIKILTGDNELVAKKICDELKIPVKRIVCGSELTQMSSTEIKAVVEETTIFARITPEQKLDIIKALKANGHVVGFMGDGVNDAPALYEADVGISVDTAVDVAKDAADIVLLEKDLFVLADGIEEGRKTFGNAIKYTLMGTSSNFGNMFSAAFASIFLPFLPMLPMQILFLNLLYDVSNMVLPTDNVDEEYIKWPRRWDIDLVRKFTLFFGPFSSLYDFLTYGIMLFIFGTSVAFNLSPQSSEFIRVAALFQSGWFVESLWTEVLVMFVIRTRRIPFFTSRPGK